MLDYIINLFRHGFLYWSMSSRWAASLALSRPFITRFVARVIMSSYIKYNASISFHYRNDEYAYNVESYIVTFIAWLFVGHDSISSQTIISVVIRYCNFHRRVPFYYVHLESSGTFQEHLKSYLLLHNEMPYWKHSDPCFKRTIFLISINSNALIQNFHQI